MMWHCDDLLEHVLVLGQGRAGKEMCHGRQVQDLVTNGDANARSGLWV